MALDLHDCLAKNHPDSMWEKGKQRAHAAHLALGLSSVSVQHGGLEACSGDGGVQEAHSLDAVGKYQDSRRVARTFSTLLHPKVVIRIDKNPTLP